MQALILDLDDVLVAAPGERPLVRAGTLEALAARYRLAVVTGRPEADARRALERLGWGALLPVVVGAEQRRGEADPRGLALALSALGVAPASAAHASAASDGMQAARAAGVRAVGVVPPHLAYPAHTRALMAAGAGAVVSSPDDLPLLLPVLAGEGRAGAARNTGVTGR
jgi:phosphoglycolate phosphatase-like HAD superfamily hydrolase